MSKNTIDKILNDDLTSKWIEYGGKDKSIGSYTNSDILEDIEKAKELKSILKYEKFKFDKKRKKNLIFKKISNISLDILLAGVSVILLSVDILTIFIILPFIALKIGNDIKEHNLNMVNKNKGVMYNTSIIQLNNFIDDLNNVLENRKGNKLTDNKIKNLSLNLSLDSKFYNDLFTINKNFSPKETISKVKSNPNEYMLTLEYYNYVSENLISNNNEEKIKIKKIECDYLFKK